MRFQTTHRMQKDENGVTAIVVTVILMIVISITTLGFTQVTRREQRQALDNQLSTQAFYAAESGVNLAKSRLASVTNKTTCDDTAPFTGDYVVSAASDVRITCLLIQKELNEFQFTNVTGPRVVKIKDRLGQNFTEITVAWQSQSGAAPYGCASAGSLPSLSGADTWNCGQPLLRLDLVPICETANCLNQNTLYNSQSSMFLYPISSGVKPTAVTFASASLSSPAGTHLYGVSCNGTANPRYCVARIVMPGTNSNYAARISSQYGAADVTVSARTLAGASTLIEGQTRIDSTARAVDVVKRIQVNVGTAETQDDGNGPLTITGTGLCKRYFITDVATTGVGSIVDPNNPCGIN